MPIELVEPTPYRRNLSATHVEKLETVIGTIGRFLDPIGFTQRMFQFLVDWSPGVDHPGFARLLKDIDGSPRARRNDSNSPHSLGGEGLIQSGLSGRSGRAGDGGCDRSHAVAVPARVQVKLTTERVDFEIAGPSPGKTTLGGFDVQSIVIERFSALLFESDLFEVADPSQYRVETDDFPPSAWKSLSRSHDKIALAAKGQERHPRVRVESRPPSYRTPSIWTPYQ